MAKSIRAKAKMAARRRQRERGNYHAADAARVARLSAKLLGKNQPAEGEGEGEGETGANAVVVEDVEGDAVMDDEVEKDESAATAKISTSAPRGSRHASWKSKSKSKKAPSHPKRASGGPGVPRRGGSGAKSRR